MEDASSIGARVRKARNYRDMNLEQLAGLIGRSKAWLSMVENGQIRLDRRSDIAMLAEVLDVSAVDLLGGPSPVIPTAGHDGIDVVALREVLLESSLDDPPPAAVHPLDHVQADFTERLQPARRASDYRVIAQVLPGLLAQAHHHAAHSGPGTGLLMELCVCATFTLRHLGQGDLAWIAADRARAAGQRVDDPVTAAKVAFVRAHARPAAAKSRAMAGCEQAAEDLAPHLKGDESWRVFGMLHLSAGLAKQVASDTSGAHEHLAEARRVAERVGEVEGAWQSFGPANVGVWEATIATEAGDGARALERAEQVRLGALSKGRRAALRIEQARGAAILDRPEDAARAIRAAERLSPARVHSSPLVRELLRDMVERPLRDSVLRGLAWRLGIID